MIIDNSSTLYTLLVYIYIYWQYPMAIHVWAKLMKSEVPSRPAIWPWRLQISCTSPWRRAGAWTSECMEPLPVWTRRRTWLEGNQNESDNWSWLRGQKFRTPWNMFDVFVRSDWWVLGCIRECVGMLCVLEISTWAFSSGWWEYDRSGDKNC